MAQASPDLSAIAQSLLQSIASDPDNPVHYQQLGAAQAGLGNLRAAKSWLQQAIDLNPSYAEAWYNMGVVAEKLGDPRGAASAYLQATQLTPALEQVHQRIAALAPSAQHNRWPAVPPQAADAETWALDPSDDEADLRSTLRARPADASVLVKLAFVLIAQQRLFEAEAFARHVLAGDAANPNAAIALVGILEERGDREAALKLALQTTAAAPWHPIAACQALFRALEVCAWDQYEVLIQRARSLLRAHPGSAEPFESIFIVDNARDQQNIAEIFTAKVTQGVTPVARAPRHPEPRITIGYMSSDLHEHPVGRIMASLLPHHDRSRFKVHCYGLWPAQGLTHERILASCDHFSDLTGYDTQAAAHAIAEDRVDILVDLNGFTFHNRIDILAAMPAPLQVNYLGYPGTLGAPFIDYQIVDINIAADPRAIASTEHLIRLPNAYFPVSAEPGAVAEASRAQFGLPAQGTVFCNFNGVTRLNPVVFSTWMRILARVPGAVLWLSQVAPEVEFRLKQFGVTHGIDTHRLIFAPRHDEATYRARYNAADLFLDTLPYNGHSTVADALQMGCPVLTCQGTMFPGRVAGSLCRAAGQADLVVSDLAAYEDLAVHLASTPGALSARRAELAANRNAPLFDIPLFIRKLEEAYSAIWNRHVSGLAPAPLDVP